MKNRKSTQGFTLVETIVTMIIAAVVAGIIIGFYLVQTRKVAESSAYAQVNRGYDLFLEQFGNDVRFANRVMDTNEVFTTVVSLFPDTSVNAIIIYNDSGTEEHRYVILNDTLYYDGDPFNIGGDVLTLESDSSWFELGAFRQSVWSHLRLTGNDSQNDFTLPKRKDLFRCRN